MYQICVVYSHTASRCGGGHMGVADLLNVVVAVRCRPVLGEGWSENQ